MIDFVLTQSGLVGVWSSMQAQLLFAKQQGTDPNPSGFDQRLVFTPDGTGRMEYFELRDTLELRSYDTFRWQLREEQLAITAGVAFTPQYQLVEGEGFVLQNVEGIASTESFTPCTFRIVEESLAPGKTLAVLTFNLPVGGATQYGRYRHNVEKYPLPDFPNQL